MDLDKLKIDMLAAVAEYVEDTEAWDDAELGIDTSTGRVAIIEADEADTLADCVDVYDMMDFVEMTPGGKWVPDPQAIDAAVEDYG